MFTKNSQKSTDFTIYFILGLTFYFIFRPKKVDAETEAAKISDAALIEQARTAKQKSDTIDYKALPQKSQTYYLGIANSIFQILNEMTWVDRDTKPLREKIIQKTIEVLKSRPDSQNSRFNATELRAIYYNFGVRTVNCGFTDYTGDYIYFINLWGSKDQISQFKYLTRFVNLS